MIRREHGIYQLEDDEKMLYDFIYKKGLSKEFDAWINEEINVKGG